MTSKGRTELRKSQSGGKNVEEVAGDVRFCIDPRKRTKIPQNAFFERFFKIFPKFSEIVQTLPNASERFRTHPDASEWIRTGPNRSERVRKRRKTCENVQNFAKNSRKFSVHLLRTAVTAVAAVRQLEKTNYCRSYYPWVALGRRVDTSTRQRLDVSAHQRVEASKGQRVDAKTC